MEISSNGLMANGHTKMRQPESFDKTFQDGGLRRVISVQIASFKYQTAGAVAQ
jgi:hypothetical protein